MTANLEKRFDAANTFLEGRVNVLNNKSSRELSRDLLPQVRAMSFFSARVAEARVLEKLRDVSDRYSQGQMNAATARLEIKNWLKSSPSSESSTSSSDVRAALMRTSRLNTILEQNAKMAAAVGARELALDPEIYEALPYYKYMPSTSVNKNPDHIQFYNIVLDKKDPFWNTHTPPLEFGCKCYLAELTAEEAGGLVGKASRGPGPEARVPGSETRGQTTDHGSPTSDHWSVTTPDGRTVDVPPSESGFVFDVDTALSTCDMSRIKKIPMRQAVFGMLRDFSRKHPDNDFRCIPGTELTTAPADGFKPEELSSYMKTQLKHREKHGEFDPGAKLQLGTLSREMSDAMGIKPIKLFLSGGTGTTGLNHNAKHHQPEVVSGEFEKNLAKILNMPGARSMLHFKGSKVFLNLFTEKDGKVVTFQRHGAGWENWELVSSFDDPGMADGVKLLTRGKK